MYSTGDFMKNILTISLIFLAFQVNAKQHSTRHIASISPDTELNFTSVKLNGADEKSRITAKIDESKKTMHVELIDDPCHLTEPAKEGEMRCQAEPTIVRINVEKVVIKNIDCSRTTYKGSAGTVFGDGYKYAVEVTDNSKSTCEEPFPGNYTISVTRTGGLVGGTLQYTGASNQNFALNAISKRNVASSGDDKTDASEAATALAHCPTEAAKLVSDLKWVCGISSKHKNNSSTVDQKTYEFQSCKVQGESETVKAESLTIVAVFTLSKMMDGPSNVTYSCQLNSSIL
jgi:hypothetical protein